DLELGDRSLAQALDLLEPFDRCGDRLGEGAEARDEVLGERLHVAAHQRAGQDELEQLIIRQRIAAGAEEALAQPLAMAVVVRRGLFGGGGWLAALAAFRGHERGPDRTFWLPRG